LAVVQFEKKHLERMIGRKLTDSDYKERIPLFGCPLEKLDAANVHFEVSPNRPDMFSIEGFARAIRSFLSGKPKLTKYKVSKGKIQLKIDSSVQQVRPYVTCAVVRRVKITDDLISSLMQVQEKLHDTLGRKRKKVAIGIHDLKRVTPPFTYKAVGPDSIRFLPLDMKKEMTLREILKKHPKGIEYANVIESARKWPIIVDRKNRVLSFPPIINGELTRVTEKTKDLFIDVTGTDERAINQALNILATSFADRGCKIESVRLALTASKKTYTPNLDSWKMKVDANYVNKILGLDLDKIKIKKLLEKMDVGFDGRSAIIPAYRADVMHPIDIAEDVAIAYGYDRFTPTVPPVATNALPLEKNDYYYTVKQLMTGLGLQEVVCLTLSNVEDEFDKMNAPRQPVAETLNAVTPECNICRRDILPSLMDVLAHNQHQEYPQKIFEVGDVIVLDIKEETGAKNVKKLACAIADTKVSYAQISSVLSSFMENLGVRYELQPVEHPSFIEGRVANVIVKSKVVGIIGEIQPKALNNWKLEMPVATLEIDLDALRV